VDDGDNDGDCEGTMNCADLRSDDHRDGFPESEEDRPPAVVEGISQYHIEFPY